MKLLTVLVLFFLLAGAMKPAPTCINPCPVDPFEPFGLMSILALLGFMVRAGMLLEQRKVFGERKNAMEILEKRSY